MQNLTMNNATRSEVRSDADDLLFIDDPLQDKGAKPLHWRLFIVDDEPDVHRATTFALTGVSILGRSIEFLHAYSADEAIRILATEPDIAVLLLDAVMEREDAGLNLVKTIRNDLKLLDMRIILHTGQPGYAPEIETIHDYDINDYKTKSELTRTKLYATVTTAVRAYEQIRVLDGLAYFDRLSNLPNRNRFIALIDAHLSQDDCRDTAIAILDIDDFSEINDALGYQLGDRLLQAVAQRIKGGLGDGAVVARLGSDTFGLIGTRAALAPALLLGFFRQPFSVLHDSMAVTATLALVHLSDVRGSGAEALKDANIALKRAKKSRRGSFVVYSVDMGIDIRDRVRLLQSLRCAVEAELLFVVYQPQINLDSGQVVGMEALLRWRKDDGNYVPPDRFIALAEASGLIISIGDWVLRMACQELLRLQASGLPDLRMSVNVSQSQFRHAGFLDKLKAALVDTGVDPQYLELEITESVAMEDPDFMLETLALIKGMGISIAIDDFGTGYSSLSHLRQLPVDRLKIDRTFVAELNSTVLGGHIAAMVIELGRNLRMTVIAEGIEDENQATILRKMGCHEGQGYLYARPMPAPDLVDWLPLRASAG